MLKQAQNISFEKRKRRRRSKRISLRSSASVFCVLICVYKWKAKQTWDYQGIGLYSHSYSYGLIMLVSVCTPITIPTMPCKCNRCDDRTNQLNRNFSIECRSTQAQTLIASHKNRESPLGQFDRLKRFLRWLIVNVRARFIIPHRVDEKPVGQMTLRCVRCSHFFRSPARAILNSTLCTWSYFMWEELSFSSMLLSHLVHSLFHIHKPFEESQPKVLH